MTDVLVLGAGPAGIAVSLLVAKQGYSVEVLDPARFPREKICGEFLNPQAVHWLHDRNLLKSLLSIHPFPVYGMKIHNSQGDSFTGHYASYKEWSGYAVMRKSFDMLLVGEARRSGIEIREGWSARRLLFDGDNVCGVAGIDANGESFEKRSKVVIGADGRNNLVGRTFGWVRGIRSLRKYAFQTYYEGLPGLDHFGEVTLVKDGYVGIAPIHERLANVALVVDEKALPGADTDPATFLQDRIQKSVLADRFVHLKPSASVITAGPLAFEVTRTSGRHTMLVGDTCGFIDPFTGEGINYAFLSASLAADTLDGAFRSGHFEDSTLAAYDRARKTMFERKFAMSRLLQKAIGWQSLGNYLVRRFAKKTDLADTVVSAVGSAVPVDRVWSLSFLLNLVL